MDVKKFFDFGSKPASSTVQAHLVDTNIDHLKLIKGDYTGIEFPVVFKQEYGSKLYDLLDTGHAGFLLISDRMKSVLEENKLTGWKTFPIKLYDKEGEEILGYHGFSVIGKCGPTNYKNCEIIKKRLVPKGPLCQYYKGVTIDTWDGNDFVTPEGTYETFITRKAADILKKHRISNMYLQNLADSEMAVENIL